MGKSIKKDSESFVSNNPFDEFNNQIIAPQKTVIKGKEVVVAPDKEKVAPVNEFESFNQNLKKKDTPSETSSQESLSKESPEGSTYLSNGKFVPPVTSSFNDALSFVTTDYQNAIKQGLVQPVKIFPKVDANGQPLVDEENTHKRFMEMVNTPEKMSEYLNNRIKTFSSDIETMNEQREALVIKGGPMMGGMAGGSNSNMGVISDPSAYNKLTSDINKQEAYLREMRLHVSEIVGNKLIEQHLQKKKNSIGIPKELGRQIIKFSDKATDEKLTALEQTKMDIGPVPKADLEVAGISAWKKYLAEHPELENRDYLVRDVQEWEKGFEERNPELTAARVKHKIGATLFKESGAWGSIFQNHPSIDQIKSAALKSNLSPTEQKIFETYVLPNEKKNIGTDIPTSGFILKMGEAMEQGVSGLVNVFRGDNTRIYEGLNQEVNTAYDEVGELGRDKQEYARLKQKESSKEGITNEERAKINSFEKYVNVRKWYDNFWDGTGDLTGQVLYQATLARVTGGIASAATKVPVVGNVIAKGAGMIKNKDAANLMVSSFLTSYDGHSKEAALLMPAKEQALQRRLYAWTMSAAEGFSERIFNDTKVLDAFKKGISPDVVKLVNRISANEISKEAAVSRMKDIIVNRMKPFGKEFLKAEFQESTEEGVVDIAQGIAESIFAGKDFDAESTFKNATNTFLTTMAYSPFVSGLASVKDVRSAAYGKSGLYRIATNPEMFKREIYDQVDEGSLNQQEADQKIKIINTATSILNQIPEKRSETAKGKVPMSMDYPERVNYLVHRLNETLLDEQIANTTDEVVKKELETKRDRSKKIREQIFNGNVVSGNNLEEIALDNKVAEELGITPVETVEEDALPIGILKPKIKKDENSAKEQVSGPGESGPNIGQENSPKEQVSSEGEEQSLLTTKPGEKSNIPSGFTEAQFNKLPQSVKDKIISQQNKGGENAIQKQSATESVLRNEGIRGKSELQGVQQENKSEKTTSKEEEIKSATNLVNKLADEGKLGDIYTQQAKENPEEFLKFVAQQSNNITSDEQFNTTTDSRASAERTFGKNGKELIDAANALFPEYKDIAAKHEQQAENVPSEKKITEAHKEIDQHIADAQDKYDKAQAERLAYIKNNGYPTGQDNIFDKLVTAKVDAEDHLNRLQKAKENLLPLPEVKQKQTVQKTQKETPADVSFQPISKINTDVKRFQPRGAEFSQESVDKIVNNFDQNKISSIVLFKDKNGKDYVLAGHSRLEAHKQLSEMSKTDPRRINAEKNGFIPGKIEAKYFKGTEKEAIEFADRSNDLGTKNKDWESAASLRRAREQGQTKTAIQERAKTDFGKNWRYINNLSYLNPNGKTVETIKQFENNPDKENQNKLEKAAQWIGAVRERLGDMITNQHENEMFDFLMDKTRSTKFERENDFISLIQNITGRFDYNENEPLNLNKVKNKSTGEVNYEIEEAELKQSIKDRQKEVDGLVDRLNNPQNAAYVNPNAPDYADVLKVADQKKNRLNAELTALRKELVDLQQQKGKIISTGMAQPGLFDINNLSPVEQEAMNTELAADNINLQNIEEYEQGFTDDTEVQQPQDTNQPGQTEILPETVQPADNEQGTGQEQNTGGAAVQGQQRTGTGIDSDQIDMINDVISDYGWTSNLIDNGANLLLINRKGTPVAYVSTKGKRYTFSNMEGGTLMTGNGKLATSIETLLKDYFYAQHNDDIGKKKQEGTNFLKTIYGDYPNDSGVYNKGKIDTYILPNPKKGWKGVPNAAIYYVQLENGKWISDNEYNTTTGGSSGPLHDGSDQFDTKEEAVNNSLDIIEKGLGENFLDKNPSYKKWINKIRAEVNGTKDVKKETPQVDLIEQQKKQRLEDAKAAFKESLRKSRGQANVSFVPIDPEVVANGVKLIAAYADLGFYKFKQIIADVADSFGSEYLDPENVNALKGVYSYYRSNLPKEEREQFDNEDAVDDFIENDLKLYSSPASMTEEQHLQKSIDDAVKEEDEETADFYRDELNVLKTNPFGYWSGLYTAGTSEERTAEALNEITKLAVPGTLFTEQYSSAKNPPLLELKSFTPNGDAVLKNPNGTEIKIPGTSFIEDYRPTEIQKSKNGTGTANNLESNSPRTESTNTMGEGSLFPVRESNNIELGEGSDEIIGQLRPVSSPGLLPFDATTVRASGDSELPIGEQLEGLVTSTSGNADTRGSDISDDERISSESEADQRTGNLADEFSGSSVEEKIKQQKDAEPVPVKDLDLDNISETLPFLYPDQHNDVLKAEKRFFGDAENPEKLYGKGMMFTNGTGTGKTLSALGIAKRFVKRGKKNILIVVTTGTKVNDWAYEATEFLQMEAHKIKNTKDKGKEMNITTYANFRKNAMLQGREWDLVIYDESHKICSNGKGALTSADIAHNLATTSPRIARQKAKERINFDQRSKAIYDKNRAARENNGDIDYDGQKLLDAELDVEAVKEFKKTKVVFLSATPFSYHPNLTYADGYLFKIREDLKKEEGRTYGYNVPNSYNSFYISNFGYHMKNNRLNRPDSGVDVDLLERQFTEGLKNNGVVVSRKLDVPFDYSRQFIVIDDELGAQIDAGIAVLNDREKFPLISNFIHNHLTPLYKNQLMEALKARWAVKRIEQHLALGRKIVVSHTYKKNDPIHPFRFYAGDIVSPDNDDYRRVQGEIDAFEEEYPEYVNLDMSGLKNPIELITETFKERVVLFNGDVPGKERIEAKKKFNQDGGGVDIFMVQMQAGKEGISLHDKTGKHQRALINLGLPYLPTDAIQIEGRTYRYGQKSDSVIEYPILNLSFERMAYAFTINKRARTAENLALGEEARNLETAFKEGYINATNEEPSLEQGRGGKKEDARIDGTTEFQKSLTYYYKRGKRSAKQKSQVSGDYYATPEPLGYKMAEWMNLVANEKGLEPSSGHGAIARFFPRTSRNIFIEPNTELRSETAITAHGETKAGDFEDLHIINKFDGIAMNPPFGKAGKLAMEHLEKAMGHLNDMGRVVALVPTGKMSDRINDWQDSDASKGFYIRAKIMLPSVVFERAGTQVMTQIIVIDKILDKELAKNLPPQRNVDLSYIDNAKEFFNEIEDMSLPQRLEVGKYAIVEELDENGEPIPGTAKGGSQNSPQSRNTSAPLTKEDALSVEEMGAVPLEPANDIAEVIKNFHQKKQQDNWAVKLKKQVSGADFNAMRDEAKNMGGYYSNFKGNGAIPGFQFNDPTAANKFMAAISGENVPEKEGMTVADRIRTWKIAQSAQNLYSTVIPGAPQLWNFAVETVAKSVEAGAALIEALKKGKEYIEANWEKPWKKALYNQEMMMELKNRGVLTYNLTPQQRQEADQAIRRIERTGKLIKEVSDLREAFDNAKSYLNDPQDIQELEDSYTEFERYLFDGLAAQEIERMENFHLGLADQTWWQKTKENWQNRYQRLEQIQKEIEKSGLTIDEKNDMVNRADRWKSIAAAKIDDILHEVGLSDVDVFIWKGQKKLNDSLFDRMAKDGVDYRKFNLYMYAKHAPERNAHNAKVRREKFAGKIASIENEIVKYQEQMMEKPSSIIRGLITRKENELQNYTEYEATYNDPTSNKNYLKMLEKKIDRKFLLMDDGGSGMTFEQSAAILDEVRKEGVEPLFERYETDVREKIIRKSLELQKEYGLIDDDNYEYLTNYYQNYVPLSVDDSYFEKNQAFSSSGIPGATIYKSKGAEQYDFEKRVNPLTQSIINLQAVIFEGEENEYKKTIANAIKTAPDKDIWQLRPAVYAPIKDKQGKVVGLDEIDPPDNGIAFTDDGQKKYLVINDKALFEALKGVNVKNAVPILAKVNGIFRSLFTLYNPAFTAANLFRDVQTAGIVLSTNQSKEVSANYRGNVKQIFSIIKGSYLEQGDAQSDTYWKKRAQEYKDAGGNMTWFHQETSEKMITDIEESFKKYQQSGLYDAGQQMSLKVADFINRANTAVENSTRLAIFDALLKANVPQYKAVEISRNATINFNKKGNYGPLTDSMFLFFNAAVQGSTNVIKTLLTTKQGLKMSAGIMLAGMMTTFYNNMMSDCSDDPANCYDNIPDYEKERNIIIKTPGAKGFIKIPLAYGFNVFFNMGEQIAQGVLGNTNISKATAFIVKSSLNSFNPIGSVDQPVLQQISPTVTDPVVQYFTNKDAFGRPIYNEYQYDRRPDSEKGSPADSPTATEFASWLNKTSGGNEKLRGKIDIAPGTLDWIYETFTGGMGQFTSQTINSTRNAFDPRENVEMRKVPIVNRFYTVPRERSDRGFIYNAIDDSYNTIFSPDQLEKFNKEMDKSIRLKEIGADRGTAFKRTVNRNQYRLSNQPLFEVLDRSKNEVISDRERADFIENLENKAERGEIPKEWIKTFKSELSKNQNRFK